MTQRRKSCCRRYLTHSQTCHTWRLTNLSSQVYGLSLQGVGSRLGGFSTISALPTWHWVVYRCHIWQVLNTGVNSNFKLAWNPGMSTQGIGWHLGKGLPSDDGAVRLQAFSLLITDSRRSVTKMEQSLIMKELRKEGMHLVLKFVKLREHMKLDERRWFAYKNSILFNEFINQTSLALVSVKHRIQSTFS